jgi:DNA polymerase III alpha subunit (gram-positive type)
MIALILDTETTGLIDNLVKRNERQPEIMEIYMCLADLRDGTIKSEYESLVKPTKGVPKAITDITGISNETVKDAPPFGFVADRVQAMIEAAPVVIAHNATFDHDMIDIEFSRLNKQIKWPKLICTTEQTIFLTGQRMTMSALHTHLFGEPFEGAHRAKQDVEALLRCCVELLHKDML